MGRNILSALWILGVLLILVVTRAIACPTCVGRITDYSPPFFSDEAYRSAAQEQASDQNNTQANEDTGEGLLW